MAAGPRDLVEEVRGVQALNQHLAEDSASEASEARNPESSSQIPNGQGNNDFVPPRTRVGCRLETLFEFGLWGFNDSLKGSGYSPSFHPDT